MARAGRDLIIGLIIMVGCLNGLPAHGAQKLIAGGEDDLAAVVSAREVTRISVRGDRITSMARGATGFIAENNATTGDLFIRPQGEQIEQPINLFLTTEKGHTYKLFLQPQDVPAEQIIIVNRQALLEHRVGSSSYRADVAGLVARLIRAETADCVVNQAAQNDVPMISAGFGFFPIATLNCAAFIAEDVAVIGGDHAVTLSEPVVAEHFGGRVAAVWLEADRLPPFGTLRALIIRASESGQ